MKEKEILNSWKDIARYLERDIKTCYRWEKELGLPIHRIDDTSSRSNVFAYREEIDLWLKEKAKIRDLSAQPDSPPRPWISRRIWLLGVGLVVAAVAVAYLIFGPGFSATSSSRSGELEQSYPSAFDEITSLGSINLDGTSETENVLAKLGQEGVDAWELYSQGNYFLEKNSQESLELATALFLKSVQGDEAFPLGYIGLAQCYLKQVENGWNRQIEWLDKAEELAKRPGQEAENYPEYFQTLSQALLLRHVYFDDDTLAEALRWAQIGISKFPNHPHLNYVLGRCFHLRYAGRGDLEDLDQALDYLKKSYWLNPYALHNLDYAEILMLRRDFAEALRVCDQLKHFDSSGRARYRMGEIHYFAGDLEVSGLVFDELRTPLKLKIFALLYRARIASRKEDAATAQRLIREVGILFPGVPDLIERDLMLASAYMGIGKVEDGYRHLSVFLADPVVRKQKHLYGKYIALDPNFDRCREDARFQTLLESR